MRGILEAASVLSLRGYVSNFDLEAEKRQILASCQYGRTRWLFFVLLDGLQDNALFCRSAFMSNQQRWTWKCVSAVTRNKVQAQNRKLQNHNATTNQTQRHGDGICKLRQIILLTYNFAVP